MLDLKADESIKNKFIHRLSSYKPQLDKLRETGLIKGDATGFSKLYEHYSVKKGSSTYIIAPPASGKTMLTYEILINLAEFHNYKVAIFSPEGGAPVDLFAEMLWSYLKKPFLKNNSYLGNAGDNEVAKAYAFMDKHFYIIDSGLKEMDAESYFRAVRDIEAEDGIKIDAVVIDPILELNINPDNKREDVALNSFLSKIRKFSSENNIHTFISIHTRAMQTVTGKDVMGNSIVYYPQPTFFDAAGGQTYSRKGFMILSLWRPPNGLMNPLTQEEYHPHETIIDVLKVKPKIMGMQGKLSLYWDFKTSRFYEMDDMGNKTFAYDVINKNKEEEQESIPF